jgi:signal transduction histidine kinase
MFAILFLPRQFHIAVVENTNPNFVKKAAWVFPLYLLLINLFVLPIAVGGMLKLGPSANPDMFVLSLPLSEGHHVLAFFVALGGFSASTGMVIVAVTALSIMISNNIVMPLLLRSATIQDNNISNLFQRLLGIRRVSVVMVLILSYGYFKFVSSKYTLVSIGLISFAGVAQFAPVVLGGIFWKRGTRIGAIAGLMSGFLVWAYCLPLPTLAEGGLISSEFIERGLWGISALKPYALFGLEDPNHVSHGAFWSLLINTLVYVGVSLNSKQNALEIRQADLFVDFYKYRDGSNTYEVVKRQAKVSDIQTLLTRFLGQRKSQAILKVYERRYNTDLSKIHIANEDLIKIAETYLAGAIGAASTKILLHSIVKEDPISLEEMFNILEQTQEIMQYSRRLEQKSKELEATTQQLQAVNEQLKELDQLKADFINTVTHELRTPITSIKALAKIVFDNPELPQEEQARYLSIIVNESERISRLVSQVLDLEKIQSLKDQWEMEPMNLKGLVEEAYSNFKPLMDEHQITHKCTIEPGTYQVYGARDRLMQALVNLIGNSIKFCNQENGQVSLLLKIKNQEAIIQVADNGVGISKENQSLIFEKFAQVTDSQMGKPKGSGLGLSITSEIMERHNGTVSLESKLGHGATFSMHIPLLDSKPQNDSD